MQTGSAQYTNGRRAPVLEPSHSFRAGGKDRTRALQKWNLDRSYNSDLPETMRAFSGSSAAQLTYELSGVDEGSSKSGPSVYGPWAPRATGDITRPGQSVNLSYGYRGENLAAFRGTVRDRKSSSGGDVVSVSALDGAERLRSAAIIPRPYTTAVYDQYVLSPALVVDNMLRDAGIHSAPPPRYDNLLYVSGHDGVFPYRGSYLLSTPGQPWSTTRSGAPFTAMASPVTNATGSNTAYYPRKRCTENGTNSSFWLEFWTNNTGIMANTNKRFEVALYFKDVDPAQDDATYTWYVDFTGAGTGSFGLAVADNDGSSSLGSTFTNTQTGVYHFSLFLNPDITTGAISARLRVCYPDKTIGFTSPTTMPSFTAETNRYLERVNITGKSVPFEALQVCKTANVEPALTYADTTQAGSWVRGAYFPDECLYKLQFLPNVTGTKWDMITAIAKATVATAEFDEFGQFYWREFTRFMSAPSVGDVDLQVTSLRDLSSLTVKEEIDACRNVIEIQNTSYVDIPASPATKQYASTGNPSIASGASASFVFPIDDDLEFDPYAPPRLANTIVSTGNWVTAMNVASGGVDANIIKTGVEIEGFHNENRQYQVTVYNLTGSTIWLYKSGGSGSGVLMEIPYDDTGFEPKKQTYMVQNTTSQSWYGKQSYYHDGGAWLQPLGLGILYLGAALLGAGEYPIPTLEDVEIIPDARVQLGDVVQVIDRAGNNLSQLAWVVGINTSGDSGMIRQRLTLRGTAYPGVPTDTGLTPDPPVDVTKGSTT